MLLLSEFLRRKWGWWKWHCPQGWMAYILPAMACFIFISFREVWDVTKANPDPVFKSVVDWTVWMSGLGSQHLGDLPDDARASNHQTCHNSETGCTQKVGTRMKKSYPLLFAAGLVALIVGYIELRLPVTVGAQGRDAVYERLAVTGVLSWRLFEDGSLTFDDDRPALPAATEMHRKRGDVLARRLVSLGGTLAVRFGTGA